MEEHPRVETTVERWRAVTADVLRPIPYSPTMGAPAAPVAPTSEKPDFAAALLRGKWLVVLTIVLGALYGVYRVIKQVPLYEARTTLEMMTPNLAFMGQAALDPQADSYVFNQSNVQTQLHILQGAELSRRTQERVSLESPPLFPPSGGSLSNIRNRLRLVPQENMDFLHVAISSAAQNVSARQIGFTKLIELSSESISAETAANYVNTLAAEYIAQSQQVRNSGTTRTLQWLSTQLEDAKSQMTESEAKLQQFLKTTGQAFVLDRTTLDDSKLGALEGELSATQTERIAKQSRWEIAKSSDIDSLPEILDDGSLRGIQMQITGLKRDRAVLLSKLTAVNPKVQTLDAQIAELERTLKTEKANLFQRIQNEYQAALRREKLELDAYNKQTQTVAGQSEKAYEYTTLKRDAETERLSYNSLLQQYNQMSIAAAVPSSFIRVIEPAMPVNIPVEPKPVRDVALPALGGLALGIVLLILKELIGVKNRARVFAAPGASGQVLNVPELGILPAFELVDSQQHHARFGLPARRARPVAEIVSGPVAWSKEPFLTESIRHAFASIRARNIDGAHRLYIVASASPSEGKTTVVGNLALAIAETGQRVLMVDADLRRPRLADVFRLDGAQGLSDIYAAETPIADISLDGFIKKTDTPGLFLLSSGEADARTVVELPFSSRIRELFVRLRKEFDYVLIDTPPSIQFSDARILGQISDGVILVIRSGVSSRGTVSLTVRRFEDDGVVIVGTILNHFQPGRNGMVYDDYFMQRYRAPYSGVPKV